MKKTIQKSGVNGIKALAFGIILLFAGSIACMYTSVSRAAEGSYISEVTVRSGESATSDLTEDGYTVLYPAVANDTWIGYRTTSSASSAITDICLGGDGQREIDGKSVSYEKASGQVSGKSLFYTKSSDAGEPLMGLHFVTGDEDESVMPLMNNGAVTVRRTDGEITEINSGSDRGYLIQIKKNIWKPYISDIKVANAGSKKDALLKLGAMGCDYYVDEKLSSKGYIMIGYSKTDDEKEAVTDAVVIGQNDASIDGYEPVSEEKLLGGYLYVSKDTEVGNPLYDIDVFESPEEEKITEADWVGFESGSGNTAVITSYYLKDSLYEKMSESQELCEIRLGNIKERNKKLGLVVISDEKGLDAKKAERESRLEVLADTEEPEDDEDDEIVDGENPDGENPDGDNPDGESGTDGSAGDTDDNTKLNPQVETDEPAAGGSESQDYAPAEEQNTDLVAAADEQVNDINSIEDLGTVVEESSWNLSLGLTIVLIALGVLIPIVTMVIKKAIDHSGKKVTKE